MTRLDLHVHTALSACAEDVMSPRQVLDRAERRAVDVLAITDHNAVVAAESAYRMARTSSVRVLPGMEITTREEVHLLALFDDPSPLHELAVLVDYNLPAGENDDALFGYQLVYDERDEIIGVDDRLRQTAVMLSIDRLVDEIQALGGLAIPAHVFRPRNSLTSQLGFIDPTAGYDALEVRWRYWQTGEYQLGDRIEGFAVMTGSDAHFLEDVGRQCLELNAPVFTVADLKEALQ